MCLDEPLGEGETTLVLFLVACLFFSALMSTSACVCNCWFVIVLFVLPVGFFLLDDLWLQCSRLSLSPSLSK